MPQTAQEIWAWLVELLPVAFRPYAGFFAASLGVIAGVAAVANPLIGLWRSLRWENPGRPLTREEVHRNLAEGRMTLRVAKYLIKQIDKTDGLPAQQRNQAVRELRAMARRGTPDDKAALEAFANGETERGFAAIAARLAKSAPPTAREVQRIGALAYASASKSAITVYKNAAGTLGRTAAVKAQALLRAMQARRNATDGGRTTAQ
jgi:hypothetical protein